MHVAHCLGDNFGRVNVCAEVIRFMRFRTATSNDDVRLIVQSIRLSPFPIEELDIDM